MMTAVQIVTGSLIGSLGLQMAVLVVPCASQLAAIKGLVVSLADDYMIPILTARLNVRC